MRKDTRWMIGIILVGILNFVMYLLLLIYIKHEYALIIILTSAFCSGLVYEFIFNYLKKDGSTRNP